VDLKVRSLVAPAVVSGASFSLVVTIANKGDRTSRRSKVRAFLSEDKGRGRGDVRLLAAKSMPPLAPGARARETVTARIPRSTDTGHWFVIVCAAAARDANSRNDCRLSSRRTTVWNYPDASNTGPTGSLRESTGNLTVSTPGAVIENRKINGCVTVNARDVTIRNSEIHCDGRRSVIWSGSTGLLVENSKIECGHQPGQTGIADRNFTIRGTETFGCENIIWAEQDVVIEDNYIHDPIPYDRARDPHTDSIQMPTPSRNITIRHNTIYGGYISQQNFGNSAITSGQSTNVLVTNNLMAGGGHTFRCPAEPGGYTWTNNRFSRIFVNTVGGFGPIEPSCWQHMHSGNVYHETGKPLKRD
jgi:CARDB protein